MERHGTWCVDRAYLPVFFVFLMRWTVIVAVGKPTVLTTGMIGIAHIWHARAAWIIGIHGARCLSTAAATALPVLAIVVVCPFRIATSVAVMAAVEVGRTRVVVTFPMEFVPIAFDIRRTTVFVVTVAHCFISSVCLDGELLIIMSITKLIFYKKCTCQIGLEHKWWERKWKYGNHVWKIFSFFASGFDWDIDTVTTFVQKKL